MHTMHRHNAHIQHTYTYDAQVNNAYEGDAQVDDVKAAPPKLVIDSTTEASPAAWPRFVPQLLGQG